jgi:enamine deaminase RidA (YjgF/YER057c/UK114 family)
MARKNISTGTPWEAAVGYSRAVRVGNTVHVAGTTATDKEGRVVDPGDPYAQTVYIFKRIEAALHEAGAALSDVVRVRIYTTNIDHEKEIGRAHYEVFGRIRPATTMIEIGRLVLPEMLVEIEVEAIIEPVA